jgi:hypothetical protein
MTIDPSPADAFRFHLLGGVTSDEAEEVEKHHGTKWGRCWCGQSAVGVLLLRGPSGRYGDVQGGSVCAQHEATAVSSLKTSTGYMGATVEMR